MPFTLGDWVKQHVAPFTTGYAAPVGAEPPTISNHFELADEAATTSPVMQAPQGIAMARVVIRQKGWGSGSGTVGPTYAVEVAYDSGFTSQRRRLAEMIFNRAGVDQTAVLSGVVPDAQTYTFARVLLTLSGTDVVTYDALVDFLPGI